jgi:hypothetical protein
MDVGYVLSGWGTLPGYEPIDGIYLPTKTLYGEPTYDTYIRTLPGGTQFNMVQGAFWIGATYDGTFSWEITAAGTSAFSTRDSGKTSWAALDDPTWTWARQGGRPLPIGTITRIIL